MTHDTETKQWQVKYGMKVGAGGGGDIDLPIVIEKSYLDELGSSATTTLEAGVNATILSAEKVLARITDGERTGPEEAVVRFLGVDGKEKNGGFKFKLGLKVNANITFERTHTFGGKTKSDEKSSPNTPNWDNYYDDGVIDIYEQQAMCDAHRMYCQ